MTATTALVAFAIAAGILTLTPGLDTALVLRTSAVEGARRALMAGLGICAGCLVWGAAAAGYLCYLGVRMLWRSRGALPAAPDAAPMQAARASDTSALGWFLRGCLTNVLNPKVGVFYITFLPQFIPQGADVLRFSLLLALLHAAMGVLWFVLLVAATRPLARWLARPAVARGLDRLTGGVFIAFGVKLALERR